MATEQVIGVVVDSIVAAFGGDPTLFATYLTRARLETELAALVSAQRKARSEQAAGNAEKEAAWAVLEAQRVAKLAEIDAL